MTDTSNTNGSDGEQVGPDVDPDFDLDDEQADTASGGAPEEPDQKGDPAHDTDDGAGEDGAVPAADQDV
jgi:hypothetical protein